MKDCPKCASAMVEGYLIDHTLGGGAAVNAWREGVPQKSIWTGLKLRGTKAVTIVTWRCRRCYYLESYAPDVP
jgi:predicted nucleic-acid-binding Zn-ribbon protein